METQEKTELQLLKEEATEKGVIFSPNIGLQALKARMEEPQDVKEEKFDFEKAMLESFNTAIQKEKDAYSEKFDIKRGKFIFWFTERNQAFVDRFVKSLVQWVKTHDLSIDKLTMSDVAFTQRSITVFPTRSPKPLTKRQREELKNGHTKQS